MVTAEVIISEVFYILFSFIIFIMVFLCPLFFILLKIFNHNQHIDYWKLNGLVFVYYIPLTAVVYFFPEYILLTENYFIIFFVTLGFAIYNIPLVYLLNRFILYKEDFKSFLLLFILFIGVLISITYSLYQLLN